MRKIAWICCVGLLLLGACKSDQTETPGSDNQGAGGVGEFEPGQGERGAVVVPDSDFHREGALLPRVGDIPQWSYLDRPMFHSADTLAELIDGGAAAFVQTGIGTTVYGVLQMNQPPEEAGRAVGAEIYVHHLDTPEGARSKYSSDHEGSNCAPADGFEGVTHCMTSSTLDFLVGAYYVRVVMDYPNLQVPMTEVARIVLNYAQNAPTLLPVGE